MDQGVLIGMAIGLAAALALVFIGLPLSDRYYRWLDERQRAGALPANDNRRGRRRPIGYEAAKDVAAAHIEELHGESITSPLDRRAPHGANRTRRPRWLRWEE